LPAPTAEGEFEQLRLAQELYAAAGITTAHEGATHGAQFDLLKRAANAEKLFLDVVAYPFITDLDAVLRSNPAESFGKYNKHLKLGGCKIVLDGSVQGRTGFFTTPYLRGGPGGEADWYGSPSFMPEIFDRMIKKCYDLGLQVQVHANGDAAIDLAIKGHESAAADDLNKDRRTTIIHAQFVRKDQLEKFVRYRLIPSFFTQHAFFFSEAHLLNRGKAQTYGLSPMRSAMAMGLRPTNHTDFNVTPINQMFTLWTAVTRQSRTGEVIGPDERVSALDALKAITLNAAYQYGEEGRKGSIEVGKLADFVVLDANPLTVAPNAIKDIKVLQTIKEGRVVFPAK
jgi:predicted amidohydrolase YtcJ